MNKIKKYLNVCFYNQRKWMCSLFTCTRTPVFWLGLLAEVRVRSCLFIFTVVHIGIVISELLGWNLFKHLVCAKRQQSVHLLLVIHGYDYCITNMDATGRSTRFFRLRLWALIERFRVSPGSSSLLWAQRNRNPNDIKTNTMFQTIVCERINRTQCYWILRTKIFLKTTTTTTTTKTKTH